MMQITPPPAVQDARYIPWLIVGFFVVIAGVLFTFAYVAITTYRGVVTDHAYEKGIAYNDVIARAQAQDGKGWASTINVNARTMTFRLIDAHGNTIRADTVKLTMFRPTQAGIDRDYMMHAQPDGNFTADISDLPAIGAWEARITVQTQHGEYQASKRVVIK